MKFRVLVVVCAVVVVAACVAFQMLGEPLGWELARAATLFSYTAAGVGAAIGAFSFGRGDRLRWAWLLMAAYAAIGVGKVLFWGSPRHVGPAMGLLPQTQTAFASAVATIFLNVFAVAGLALFARV